MTGMYRVTRRSFVKWLLALGALPQIVQARSVPGLETQARRWLAEFPHPDSAREIGRIYLIGHPVEADPGFLCQSLQSSRVETATGGSDWTAAIRDDFSRGDTVCVAGWVLSRTEARLCALAVMV